MGRKACGDLIRERPQSLGQRHRRAGRCVQVHRAREQPVKVPFEPLPGGRNGVEYLRSYYGARLDDSDVVR
jgi:hypothetical protein